MLNLGSLRALLGQADRARALLEDALALGREIGAREQVGDALCRLAQLEYEEGNLAEAILLVEEAVTLLREAGSDANTSAALVLLGELRWRAGEPDAARVALEEAVALSRRTPSTSRALAHTLLACLPDGDVDAALEACERSDLGENAMQVRYLLWTLTGDREHLEEARRLLDHRLEHAPEGCRASMRANVRLYREIQDAD